MGVFCHTNNKNEKDSKMSKCSDGSETSVAMIEDQSQFECQQISFHKTMLTKAKMTVCVVVQNSRKLFIGTSHTIEKKQGDNFLHNKTKISERF